MTQVDAIVVGGGLGGLAASIVLGAQGRRTLLLEAAECLGGKAGTTTIDGVTVDTGPSVLTMPHTLLGLLRTAGLAPDDHIQLRAASPGFRYHFADDTVLDVHHAVGDTLDSVHATLGGQAARELEAFLAPRIARFKIPEKIWCQHDPLIRGATDKTDRRAIRAACLGL